MRSHDGVFRGHHLAGARRYRAGTAQKRRIQLIRLAAECYFETVDKETRQAILRNSETPSFEELAGSQGVCPVTEFETLLGHPSAEDDAGFRSLSLFFRLGQLCHGLTGYTTRTACWIASLLEAITPMSSFHDLTNDFAPSS